MILTERLLINGVVTPIAGYSVKAPTGGLAQSVTIALVTPELNLIPEDADITFEIGAGVADINGNITYSYAPPIISNGKLNGLNYTAGWLEDGSGGSPNDIIEFTALSPLAEKLTLTPERPIIMYDPVRVPESSIETKEEQLIKVFNPATDEYETVDYIKESVEELSLYKVLDRAYTNKSPLEDAGGGLGFDKVVTNIPDFPVERIDFTIEGGWHSPAASLYSRYNPEIFEFNNVFYIIAAEFGLPPGFVPVELDAKCVIDLNRTTESSPLINAVLLTYNQDAKGIVGTAGELPSIRLIDEPPIESGSGSNYVREEVLRSITEFKDINTGEIRRVTENYVETKTYGYAPLRIIEETDGVVSVILAPGEITLLSEERITNRYTGNTKAGHSRYVNALYLDPDKPGAAYSFGRVIDEIVTLRWRPDLSHPGEYEQTFSETKTSGLCLLESIPVEGSGVNYLHKVYTPILDAMETGLITADGTQTKEYKEISTELETLRDTGQNQSNVEYRAVNHLTGGARLPKVQSRPGSKSTYLPPFSVKYGGGVKAGTIRELIKDEESIELYGLRKPFVLDVGKLDPVEGRRLAKQQLKASLNPPRYFTITLPGINFLYRRGLILLPPLRSGYDRPVIITGTEITGRALHTSAALRDMRFDAREVINANETN